ncbi:nuclease-related domain-containing protein [Psychrobacillus vulpis]|uniref:NERD domain-containing protein n=1 Tax=Psychrobacillus vulpis TaxID=2325572 RepID=A0A544TQB3_9BACI|nr:nuclease-related domain-containing protein [Psychrobacillus vulpis]TQR19641.1 NERD domain-containing protein [Psychrobacillus vulpis]
MLVKSRSNEFSLIGLQLLDKRLPQMHEMKELIHSKMHMAKAGIYGEVLVESVFRKYSFPFEHVVLHDVSLNSYGNFQIDTLFLTQYFAVILESKNIAGKLSFQQNPPLLMRENDEGKVEMFESPETQIERNIYLLGEWLRIGGVNIPIYGAIVLTNSKILIEDPPKKYPAILPQTNPVFLRNMPREKVYLEVYALHGLAKRIAVSHQHYFPYPMCSRWGILPKDLLTGVHCEKCESFGMVKQKGGWSCPRCGHLDKLAHEKTIKEWFVLIGETINNRQCRYFLQLDSYHVASRLLNSMNLERSGKSKNTIIYQWKW